MSEMRSAERLIFERFLDAPQRSPVYLFEVGQLNVKLFEFLSATQHIQPDMFSS